MTLWWVERKAVSKNYLVGIEILGEKQFSWKIIYLKKKKKLIKK
jgi:hypothetical protein